MSQVGKSCELNHKAMKSSMKRGWIGWGAMGLVLLGALLLPRTMLARPHWQAAPTVDAAAITTPTATALPGLPTVTPTPPLAPAQAPIERLTASAGLTYTVRPSDTLLSVALEIGVDLADMPCVIEPTFTPDQPLVIGDVLEIPPAGMVCHAVEGEETVISVAARYRIPPEQLVALPWNQLNGASLPAGLLPEGWHLRVPLTAHAGGRPTDGAAGLASAEDFVGFMLHQPVNTLPFVAYAVGGANRALPSAPTNVPANWPYGTGHFVWPVYGWLTQGYRYDHRAVDVAAPIGTLVTAADRGVVIRAGWNNQGYGRFVIIDHNIDYITLYAHLSEILVAEGQVVGQGQAIGRVGSTGNSTGPHLHFEIRDFGRLANPLELLTR